MQGAEVVPWTAPLADVPEPIVSLLVFLHEHAPSGAAPVAFLGVPSIHRDSLEPACRFGFIWADHYRLPEDYTLPDTYKGDQETTRFKHVPGFTLTDAGRAVVAWRAVSGNTPRGKATGNRLGNKEGWKPTKATQKIIQLMKQGLSNDQIMERQDVTTSVASLRQIRSRARKAGLLPAAQPEQRDAP